MFLIIPIGMAVLSYFASQSAKDFDYEIPEPEIDKFDVRYEETADKPCPVAGAY